MQSKRHWLEYAEYVFLAASVAGLFAATVFQEVSYAVAPVVISLVLNLANRQRLEWQTRVNHATTVERLNHHRNAVEQLNEQLKTAIQSLATANSQLLIEESALETTPQLKSMVSAIKNLRQRQKILEKAIKLIQAELTMISQQFKHRPELEQIESLTKVIIDLQEFINQLPQWGTLQQRQLLELQQKVEDSLERLSQEIAEIPHQVEGAVQRQSRPRERAFAEQGQEIA